MSLWRHQAFERFPEFRTKLQESKSPSAYWIELQFAFDEAYRKSDIDLFKRILNYVDWSLDQPQGKTAEDDLGTCVYCCFLEHIPEISPAKKSGKSEVARNDLTWNGSILNQPDIKKLYENLLERQRASAKRGEQK